MTKWIKPVISHYHIALADDDDCCLVVREHNGFFSVPYRFTIDRLEWEKIGEVMRWKNGK